MMTIKEFAKICSCNAQTLRYYDRIGLLRPSKTDEHSGYRYYEAPQALDFVKIKNMQLAEFTIEEIKHLLGQSDKDVYLAFERKVAEQRDKLSKILEIQKTYLAEKTMMEKLIHTMKDYFTEKLLPTSTNDDIAKEFGLTEHEISELRKTVEQTFAELGNNIPEEYKAFSHAQMEQAASTVDELRSHPIEEMPNHIEVGNKRIELSQEIKLEGYTRIWENGGWKNVCDFLGDIPSFEKGRHYAFVLQLSPEKYRRHAQFPMMMLATLLVRKQLTNTTINCFVEQSEDGENRVRLFVK